MYIFRNNVGFTKQNTQIIRTHDIRMTAKPYPEISLHIETLNGLFIPEVFILKSFEDNAPPPLPIIGNVDNAHVTSVYLLNFKALFDHITSCILVPLRYAVNAIIWALVKQTPKHDLPCTHLSSYVQLSYHKQIVIRKHISL